MSRKPYAIGVLGGMGTYATIHLFRQYAEVFPAEKEWERPRIIIDNRCTMPSRVRAALYGEDREKLISEMSDSVSHLIGSGCSRIILACNTAHLFLEDIYRRVPEAEERILNIIETCVDGLCENEVEEALLLASEGTIESGIYQKACEARGIRCKAPRREEYDLLRDCIEAVKRNRYSDEVRAVFLELLHREKTCILGCTELPVLYGRYREHGSGAGIYAPARTEVYDPVDTGIYAPARTEVYDPVHMALTQCSREYYGGNRP